jgi:hypothetical protein
LVFVTVSAASPEHPVVDSQNRTAVTNKNVMEKTVMDKINPSAKAIRRSAAGYDDQSIAPGWGVAVFAGLALLLSIGTILYSPRGQLAGLMAAAALTLCIFGILIEAGGGPK